MVNVTIYSIHGSYGMSVIKHHNIGKLGSLQQDPNGGYPRFDAGASAAATLRRFLMIFCGKNAL